MTKLRALVFNTLFYALMLSYMVFGMFMLIIPRRFALVVIQDFMHRQLALQRLFGMKIEVRGGEHFPVKGGIIASKHQSIWETFALHSMVPDAVFIYKKELGELPLFGNYLRKFEQIEVNRKGGPLAAQSMTRAARQAIELGRQILIFPEGTRRPPGAPALYKHGVSRIYENVGQAIVPIVLNSGLYWSNYFWSGHLGTIIVEALPPIPIGLSRDEFFERLVREMEAAGDRLFVETATGPHAPPLNEEQKARLKELQAAG